MKPAWIACFTVFLSITALAQTRVISNGTFEPGRPVPDPVHDQEPALAIDRVGQTDHLVTAWMKWRVPDYAGSARIHVSTFPRKTTEPHPRPTDSTQWTAPQPLISYSEANAFSGDPYLAVNKATHTMYLVGHSRQDRDYSVGSNEIALWTGTPQVENGLNRWTWNYTSICRRSVSDTGRAWQTDKPSVEVSPSGTLYVAHMVFDDPSRPKCLLGDGTPTKCDSEIHLHWSTDGTWNPNNYVKVPMGTFSRPQSPIVLAGDSGEVHVVWVDFELRRISVASTSNLTSGNPTFTREDFTTGHLFAQSGSVRGRPATSKIMGAVSMLTARFNTKAQPHSIGIVWTEGDPGNPTSKSDVRFVAFTPHTTEDQCPMTPGISKFGCPETINATSATPSTPQNQWNPALDFDDNGNYLITYYDSTGTEDDINYHLRARLVDSRGKELPGAPFFDTRVTRVESAGSEMDRTPTGSTLGEYQDVRYSAGNWYASFIEVNPTSFQTDAAVVQITPADLTKCADEKDFLTAGCPFNRDPLPYKIRKNVKLKVRVNTASDSLATHYTYEWLRTTSTGTFELLSTDPDFDRIVNETTLLTLFVKQWNGSTFLGCDTIPIRITVTNDTCIAASCETTLACDVRRRAVRHGANSVGEPNYITLDPGAPYLLKAPAGNVAWEWHRTTGEDTDEIFATTETVEIRPYVDTIYWVEVDNGIWYENSDYFYVTIDNPLRSATATPEYQSVPLNGTATITATLSPEPSAWDGYTFEWHTGEPPNGPLAAMGGNQRTLSVSNMQEDQSFWCRVRGPNGQEWTTNVARVFVNCVDTIGGVINAWPNAYLSRTDRPFASAHVYGGKLPMSYQWYQRPSLNVPGTLFAIYGSSAWVSITQPLSYVYAVVRDNCGNTATLPDVAFHLCVPTIDTPPTPQLVTAGSPATLTLEASPALAGQQILIRWYAWADPYEQNPLGTGASFVTPPLAGGTTQTYYATVVADCDGLQRGVRTEYVSASACNFPVVTAGGTQYLNRPSLSQVIVSVNASGEELAFEWYEGESGDRSRPVPESNSPGILVRPNVTTKYWCRVVSREKCVTNSPPISVVVCDAPTITALPAPSPARIFRGATATLSVSATAVSGSEPLTYQWFVKNSSGGWDVVSSATSATFTTPPLTVDTTYRVNVSTGQCVTSSDPVLVPMCEYDAVVPALSPHNIARGESVTLRLPNPLAVEQGKTVTWYRGVSGDPASTLAGGPSMSETLTINNITEWRKYWATIDLGGCVSRTNTYDVNVCVPTITAHPQSTTVPYNGSTQLTVSTSDITPQTYQWYAGASGDTTQPISGATTRTLNVTGLTAQASFWMRATGGCGISANSDTSVVSVCTAPTLSYLTPSPQSVRAGNTIPLSVTASGNNLTYQWYTGTPGVATSPIEEATQSFASVGPTSTTTYWVRVTSGGVCSTDSSGIVVEPCTDPAITTQPQPANIRSGQQTTLSVGGPTSGVTYQWYNADTADPITGAANATLTVSPAADTRYYVIVKRGACSTKSATVQVTVCSLTASLGNNRSTTYQEWVTLTASLQNSRVSSANAHYTWYQGNGTSFTSFNSGTGMTQRAVNPATTTQYYVRVSDGMCTYDSAPVTVNVCVPTITAQPAGTLIQPNQTAVLSVSTTNISGQTFRWYIGAPGNVSQPAPGASATTATYTTPALSATTSYWVRVSGPCGVNADSDAAVVTVCQPAAISAITPTRYIRAGTSTWHQVYATGSNLTYQWYTGTPGNTSNPIEGATLGSISVTLSATTTYWARVWTDGLCTKDSGAMVVDVCTNPVITAQPASTTITPGQSKTLTVGTSTSGVMYQWYSGSGMQISGATGASISVSPSVDTNYYCVLTRNACSVTSATASVKVCILGASVSGGTNIAVGQHVLLTATPSNSRVAADSATYTWYTGTGANATVFNSGVGMRQRQVNPGSTTDYWVRINDGTCSADSNVTRVSVCIPTITSQPQGASINQGQSVALSVAASGAPLTYKWFYGNPGDTSVAVPNGDAASITVSPSATTTYWARVTGCSVVHSAAAMINVCVPPSVTSGPLENGIRVVGAQGSVWVTAAGANLTYQWYHGQSGDMTQPIPGANSDRYDFTNQYSAYFWVRIAGTCGVVNSAAVLHAVYPNITQQPANATVPPNGTATLKVVASGTYLTYQWYRGYTGDTSNPMTGATSATFTTPPITATTWYWVRVTSAGAALNLQQVSVSLCTGPRILQFRAQYNGGNNWWLSVTLSSSEAGRSMRYLWYTGVPGNLAQSTFKYEANAWTQVLATQQETWWCRVWYDDNSCYSDTPGQTIMPLQ